MKNQLLVRAAKAAFYTLTAVILGIASLSLSGLQSDAAQSGVYPSPDAWVAFTANVTRTMPDGVVVGRYIQWPDGSSRYETGPAENDMRSIDIKNVELERWFGFLEGKGWIERPMRLRGGFQPPKMLARNLTRATKITFEGHEAFTTSYPDGRTEVVVPGLNYWVVDRVTPDGLRVRFHNIKIGDIQDRALLVPPVNEAVRFNSAPTGIIQHGPEDVEVDASGKVRFK